MAPIGSIQLVTLLLAVGVTFLASVIAALDATLLGALTASRFGAAFIGVTLTGLLLAGAELAVRTVRRRRDPRWVASLSALRSSKALGPGTVGTDAYHLGRAASLGLPVPDMVVLTCELTEQWYRDLKAAKKGADPWDLLPEAARQEIEAFLFRAAGGKIVVRPSFGDDAQASYPGVFGAVPDVDPTQRGAVLAAFARVVESGFSGAATEYRRRMKLSGAFRRAVMLQRQVVPDLTGSVLSRALDGRADSVIVDYAKPRSAMTSVSYDLLDGTVLAVAPDVALEATPSWMNRVVGLALAVDHELGDTALLDFAVERGQIFVLTVRRVASTEERHTWVSSGGPLASDGVRQPRFIKEALGESSLVIEGIDDAFGALGSADPSEVRDEDGVRFLSLGVLRRGLAALSLGVLVQQPLVRLLQLARPRRARPLLPAPDVGEDVVQSWRRFRTWQTRSLWPALTQRNELALRRWLIDWVVGMLGDGATGEPIPRAHRVLRRVLSHRASALAAEVERVDRAIDQVEPALRRFATGLMGRGAADFSAMFEGDRALFAGLGEMESWVAEPRARDALTQRWDAEKKAFQAREARPLRARAIVPATSLSMASRADSALRVVGIVPGRGHGYSLAPTEQSFEGHAQITLVLPDGRSQHAGFLLKANALILTGGGVLSPMAQLARELGIPTVACVDRVPITRFPRDRNTGVDGTLGLVVF